MRSIHVNEIRDKVNSYSPPLFYEFLGKTIMSISYKKKGKFLINKHPLTFDCGAKDLVYTKNIYSFFDILKDKINKDEYSELQTLFKLS